MSGHSGPWLSLHWVTGSVFPSPQLSLLCRQPLDNQPCRLQCISLGMDRRFTQPIYRLVSNQRSPKDLERRDTGARESSPRHRATLSSECRGCASVKAENSCCRGPAVFQLCPSRVPLLSFSWVSAKPVYSLEMHRFTLFPYSFSNRSCFEQASGPYNTMS